MQSLNRYAYALNNPETLVDPSGLGPVQVNFCGSLKYGVGLGMCQTEVNGVIMAEQSFGGGWAAQPFELLLPTGCDGEDCGPVFDLNAFQVFLNEIGPVASGGGASNLSGTSPLSAAWQITKQVAQCAASSANQHSLANELGLGGNTAANIFLGNDAATLSNLVLGPNRAGSAGSLLVSNPTSANLAGLAGRGLSLLPNPFGNPTYNITVGAASVSTNSFDLTAVSVDVSKTVPTVGESAFGAIAGGLLNGFTAVKAAYDGATYVGGIQACSGYPLAF
jgi:hypothetical protein